jgi:regulator of replication initiation timing
VQIVRSVKRKNNSSSVKCRSKKVVTLNKSNMSYINNTLPITNNNSMCSHLNFNIIAENSKLRTENDLLKRELHSQYKVSAFMKDDRNQSLNASENETSRTHKLHDKLYYANCNLQEVLLELDELSKLNATLNEQNTQLEAEKERLRIKNE